MHMTIHFSKTYMGILFPSILFLEICLLANFVDIIRVLVINNSTEARREEKGMEDGKISLANEFCFFKLSKKRETE